MSFKYTLLGIRILPVPILGMRIKPVSKCEGRIVMKIDVICFRIFPQGIRPIRIANFDWPGDPFPIHNPVKFNNPMNL